jgi:hypothetical protein
MRTINAILAVFLMIFLFGMTLALNPARSVPPPQTSPHLIIEPSVDESFAALADETWTAFLTTFAARADCFGDVHLQASYQLPARAGYDPATATVTVRVPGSAARLQAALIHEWAHHIEFQCPQQQTMRPAFLAAEGFPPDAAWRPARSDTSTDAWADIPSEHYAEAAILLVLGHNATPTQIHVRREAVDVLAAWAEGGGQ